MKRITILFTLFVLIAALTTSCNKKKLDELEESNKALQASLDASTASNAISADSINAIKALLDAAVANNNVSADSINAIKALLDQATADKNVGTAINVTYTGNKGIDSSAFSFSKSFAGLDVDDFGDNNYASDNGDGTWDIYVGRYDNQTDGWAEFYISGYDPTDDSYNYFEVYGGGEFVQSNGDLFDLWVYGDQNYWGLNNAIINSINYNSTTNAFNFNITVNTIEDNWSSSTYNPATTVFSFSGILNKDIYRRAAHTAKAPN